MKARVIAFYLPQFHPIPENDNVWGKGFTEWHNVVKGKPLFKGHQQPRIPTDLGFYDLRVPEVREEQAQLAREAGVEGFAYWHYWRGNGKMLLERPFNEVLASGKPDFPFCLAWANHDWTTKTWQRGKGMADSKVIISKQEYLGEKDYRMHFDYALKAFKDHRYITVDDKPIFLIWDAYHFKDVTLFMDLWRKWAKESGLKGVHFVAMGHSTSTVKRLPDGTIKRGLPNLESSAEVYNDFLSLGFDAVCSFGRPRAEMIYTGKYKRLTQIFLRKIIPQLSTLRLNYPEVMKYCFAPEDSWENVYPNIMPQWDRSPRAGNMDGVFVNATPDNFKQHILQALDVIKDKKPEHKILFLRSWNEWGEGNYVEPDELYGHGFLDAIHDAVWE